MSIFYTGKIAIDHIPKDVIDKKNNSKSWQYGYDKEYDVVIISRTGQIDDVIYEVEGLIIALPKRPNEEDIVNFGLPKKDQKWNREDLPKGLNDKTVNSREFSGFIGEQFYKRRHGVWIYIKGQPVYLSPTYWFGLQWYRELREYPTFRVIQNELMLFWEACCADQRCYGMNYIKNRRFGASFLGLIEEVDKGTTRENEYHNFLFLSVSIFTSSEFLLLLELLSDFIFDKAFDAELMAVSIKLSFLTLFFCVVSLVVFLELFSVVFVPSGSTTSAGIVGSIGS